MNPNSRTILIVEDDPNDVFFLQHAFQEAGLTNPLKFVTTGDQAIEYLSGTGQYSNRPEFPLPSLMLLDLKLPGRRGLEVLRWIHAQPNLCYLLVIILTSSGDPQEIDEAFRLGARSFLVKPLGLEDRVEMVKAIKLYWLGFNRFPSACDQPEPAPR